MFHRYDKEVPPARDLTTNEIAHNLGRYVLSVSGGKSWYKEGLVDEVWGIPSHWFSAAHKEARKLRLEEDAHLHRRYTRETPDELMAELAEKLGFDYEHVRGARDDRVVLEALYEGLRSYRVERREEGILRELACPSGAYPRVRERHLEQLE